jgi:hypothetical protein
MIIGMGTPNNQSRIPRPTCSSRCMSANAPGDIRFRNVHGISQRYLLLHCVANGVLGAADNLLHLACRFLRSPFGLDFGVAGQLADSLLDGALT